MSIPVFKRKESDILYVMRSYELEKEITSMIMKLSNNKSYHISSIMKYNLLQSDLVNKSLIFNTKNIEDDIYKVFLIRMAKLFLYRLKIEIKDFYRSIMHDTSKVLVRNNGRYFSSGESSDKLERWYIRVNNLINEQSLLLDKVLSKNNNYNYKKIFNIIKHEYIKCFN